MSETSFDFSRGFEMQLKVSWMPGSGPIIGLWLPASFARELSKLDCTGTTLPEDPEGSRLCRLVIRSMK